MTLKSDVMTGKYKKLIFMCPAQPGLISVIVLVHSDCAGLVKTLTSLK